MSRKKFSPLEERAFAPAAFTFCYSNHQLSLASSDPPHAPSSLASIISPQEGQYSDLPTEETIHEGKYLIRPSFFCNDPIACKQTIPQGQRYHIANSHLTSHSKHANTQHAGTTHTQLRDDNSPMQRMCVKTSFYSSL